MKLADFFLYITFTVICDAPGVPLYANMTRDSSIRINGSWYHGDKAIYECDHGYQALSGDLERMCYMDGQWSGALPKCEGIF